MFSKRLSVLLSLAAIATLGTALSAQAETAPAASVDAVAAEANSETEVFSVAQINPETVGFEYAETPVEVAEAEETYVAHHHENAQPAPGTLQTSAAPLQVESEAAEIAQAAPDAEAADVAQAPPIIPGRTTRGGSSYIGVGGNLGLGGNSGLGRGNFAVISKVGLTNNISVRPSAVFGDPTVFLVPLTFDFVPQAVDPVPQLQIAPYLGAGVAITTGGTDTFGLLVSGGVDVPLSREFTATAGVNAAFRNRTDVGVLLGVGYNFPGF